jgi:hypothetical protein
LQEVLLGVGEAADSPEEVGDEGEEVVLEDGLGVEFVGEFVEEHGVIGVGGEVGGVGGADGGELG